MAQQRQQQLGMHSELDMLSGALRPQQLAPQPTDAPAPAEPNGSSSSSSQGSGSGGVSKFVYTKTNHNSVLGIGAYAAAAGAELVPQTDAGMEEWVASLDQQQQTDSAPGSPTYNLLAYPAEDNYAGAIYPLEWINKVRV